MGHRALVAYERPDGDYTVRYSHWGAHGYRLLDTISSETPLGRRRGGDGDDDRSAGTDADAEGEDPDDEAADDSPPVRPEPLGTATDLANLAASFLDPILHEAAFVVSASFCVRAFEPLAFWGPTPSTTYGGALVALRRDRDPARDAADLRAWRRGATAALQDRRIEEPDADSCHDVLFRALGEEVGKRPTYRIPPDGGDSADGDDDGGDSDRGDSADGDGV